MSADKEILLKKLKKAISKRSYVPLEARETVLEYISEMRIPEDEILYKLSSLFCKQMCGYDFSRIFFSWHMAIDFTLEKNVKKLHSIGITKWDSDGKYLNSKCIWDWILTKEDLMIKEVIE
jgi:hypothetical protein